MHDTKVIDSAKGSVEERRRLPLAFMEDLRDKLGSVNFVARIRKDVEGREFTTIEIEVADFEAMLLEIQRTDTARRGRRRLSVKEIRARQGRVYGG